MLARQCIQNMLVVAAVALAAAYVATIRYSCVWIFSNGEVALDQGLVSWIVYPSNQSILMTPGVYLRAHPFELQWAWGFRASNNNFIGTLPIVLILALLCVPLVLVIRSNQKYRLRRLTGKCARCEFELAGLSSDAPCPECGKKRT